MKAQIISFAMLLVAMVTTAQDCFWAKKGGGFYDDYGKGVVANPNGNIYITGYFGSSSLNFGDTVLYNQSIPGYTYSDIFLTKYDIAGNLIWAKDFGSALNEVSRAIAIDETDNFYITGFFTSDSLVCGSVVLYNDNSDPDPDFFVAKLDSNGNAIWAKNAGGNCYGIGNSIALDTFGNIYVTGELQSDSIIFGNIVLHKVGTSGTDFFIVKYDPAGTVVWAKNAGGRFGNAGKGITTDISGNAYVIGDFGTDSITFDNINYLYNNCTGNGDFFIVKYDPDGNAVWAQNHSGGNLAFGYGITSDGYNVYITGIFRGSSITFGGTTINNYSPGSNTYDVFIVKYNTNGNVIWARNAGGNDDDGGRGIAVDITGNVYVIGKYRSDSIYFGNIKLYNAGPSLSYTLSYLFIVKYDAGGNPQWAERGEGTFTEQDAIVVNGVDNLYVTGSFYDDPVTIGSTTLSNSGYYDIYVAHTYSFSPVISSSANVSCNGFSDGFATLTMNGGMEPFTYLWSNGQTTPSAINLTAGNYSVSITDINDCIQTSSVNITEPPAETAAICMVTVDSLSEYNVIVWDKSLNTAAESYTIYREIATDNYQPIAAIPYDSFSQFTDTVHALYFPNTGDPNEGTYRYKIQVLDTCGGFSEMSPYHNTIYMLNSGGIFYWTLPYSIENSPNPVTSYILMRDDYSTGDWHDITSVAGTQQTVSDPLYVIYQNTASWRVKTQWSINCTPTLKNTQSYNYSLSNIFNNTTGILENTANTGISVYPNPSDGLITIHSHGQTIEHIQVHNVLGEQLFSKSINNGQNNIRLNLSALSQGVYFLKVKMRNEIVVKKIMIK